MAVIRLSSGFAAIRSRQRRLERLAALLGDPALPRVLAVGVVVFWAILAGVYFLGHDAYTYMAAGDRLNAGHPLYSLTAGDQPVELNPPYWSVPLLSPPIIGAAFRPIAYLGSVGVGAWIIATCIAAVMAVWWVVRGWRGFALTAGLGIGLGMAAISGNVSNFLLVGYVAVWQFRNRPWVGFLIGVMVVFKLLPIVFVGFLVARHDGRALAMFVAGIAAALAISVAGAGPEAHITYLTVASESVPQHASLPYLTGLRWLSPALLVAGTVIAAALPERWSYRVCIVTIVFGAPVLTWRELAALIALLAPTAPQLAADASLSRTALAPSS